MRSRVLARALGVFSLALTLGAGVAAISAAGLQGWRAEQRLASAPLQAAPPTTGLSPREHNDLLADCHQNMESLAGLLMAAEQRRLMVDSCNQIARDVAAASPRTAYAWFVTALVHEERVEPSAMIEDLVRSQELSPRSASLAYYRGQKLLTQLDTLDESARKALLSDIEAMAQAQRGLDWLARAYLGRPNYHDMIASGVEAAGPEVSRRFLAAVTRLSR